MGRRDKGIPVSTGTVLKKDFETKLIYKMHPCGWEWWEPKGAARNLAVGLNAMPLPGATASSLSVLWALVLSESQWVYMCVIYLNKSPVPSRWLIRPLKKTGLVFNFCIILLWSVNFFNLYTSVNLRNTLQKTLFNITC